MFSKIKYLILAALFFNACDTPTFEFSGNETNISGTKLDIGCLIGQPYGIIYLDPLLLFYDPYENQLITVFDAKNNQFVRRFLSKGQGPGEVATRPIRLFVSHSDKKTGVYQPQTGYLNIYEPGEIIEHSYIKSPEQVYFTDKPDKPANIQKIKDGYIGMGPFESERFRLYDFAGNTVSSFGKYPFRGGDMVDAESYLVYQGYICASTDGNSFAMGSAYCDNLEFYRIVDGEAVLTKRYESYDAKAFINGNMFRIDDNCIMNYRDAYGGKYCYMLHSGKKHIEGKYGGRRIIVFDWDGNYIKSYKVDIDIWSFCVDEENNMLYAIVRDQNDETGGAFNIFQFDLQKK